MMGPRLTLLDPPRGAEENCYISSAGEIRSVLRDIARSGVRAAAYFDDDRRFIHTSLLTVTTFPGRLVFEKGPDSMLNAKLLEAGKVTFVTSHEHVPVQFSCRGASAARHEGTDALRVPLPERVLRLQRRGYYRLPGELTHALLKCELVPHKDETLRLRAAVFDLSCGGIGAAVPAAEPLLESGSIHGCHLELPGFGSIHHPVIVRVIAEIVLPNGLPGTRYGLEFQNLGDADRALVERYILEHRGREGR
jgi:flagellar brake protein